jgi:hypothetical protein
MNAASEGLQMHLLMVTGAGVVAAILALVGIWVAIWPPKQVHRQRALGVSVAVLALVGIASEIYNRQHDARREVETTQQLRDLTAAANLARDDAARTQASNELLRQSNQELRESNQELTAEVEGLKNKPGPLEVERERALNLQIGKFLTTVESFLEERTRGTPKNPKDELVYQQTSASLYIGRYCPKAAELLQRAVALHIEDASTIVCDLRQADNVNFQGYKQLKALQQILPN